MFRIVLDVRFRVLRTCGLMLSSVSPMTITRLWGENTEKVTLFIIRWWFFWGIFLINCYNCVLSRRTSKVTRCLNLGSYNYLGFAAADEYCTPRVIETLKRFSPSTCSPRVDGGMCIISNFFFPHCVLGVHYWAMQVFFIRNYDTA